MKKTGKKLAVRASVICNLSTLELRDVAGGVKDSEPGGVCWPDPPPRLARSLAFTCGWPWPPVAP